MAKGKQGPAPPGTGHEFIAVAGVFLALYLSLCFVSYSLPALAGPSNWGGPVGEFIASHVLGFFGVSGFWLIFLLLFFSLQFFSPLATFRRLPHIFVGSTGILLASCALVAVWSSPGKDPATVLGGGYPAGGTLGVLFMMLLTRYFGGPGSVLLLLGVFLFSLMVAIRFSPYFASLRLLEVCSRLGVNFRRPQAGRRSEKPAPAPDITVSGLIDDELEINLREPVREPVVDDEDEDFQVTPVAAGEYQLPGIGMFDKVEYPDQEIDREHYLQMSQRLEEKLKDFGVSGKVVGISPGPVVTTFEFSPAPGIKINRIVALEDDLAMGLKAESVRIVGSIPGKVALGIEIPNPHRQIVHIRDILASDNFRNASSRLTLGLGKDVVGMTVVADLTRMPHLLIAGATGSGKSVGINAIICSILFKATPDEVRFLLIDPKRIELSGYEGIPHLLHPVVVDPKMANRALQWAVREMERRYALLDEKRVKNFNTYNEVAEEKLPLIVIVVDELADLMMVSSRDVEEAIARLAQMARAAGMHLILATQRPSVDVLTGLIKANFPTRISYKVFSKIDSRTILDSSGAEHLLGDGDMLLMPPGKARLQRIHGAYISEGETERLINFIKEQGATRYDESAIKGVEETPENGFNPGDEEYDEKYDEAVALVCETGQASISMLQRRLRVGYNRAARMIELMEKEGVVGPSDGVKARDVIARRDYKQD